MNAPTTTRRQRERLVGMSLPEMTSEADWLARSFADRNGLSINEFRAILFVALAESKGAPLTASNLRDQMSLSGAAITYLVERLTETGHLRREADPVDRRKKILRSDVRGTAVSKAFVAGLTEHNHRRFAAMSDTELESAHRVFRALVDGIQSFREGLAVQGQSWG